MREGLEHMKALVAYRGHMVMICAGASQYNVSVVIRPTALLERRIPWVAEM